MKRRPIATRYAALVVVLLAVALGASGALETWSSHRDRQAIVEALQREKAQAAAQAVAQFVEDVQRSLEWATLAAPSTDGERLERRQLELFKLLRLEPSVTTASIVDATGVEQVRVSRIAPNRLASGVDLSRDPGFVAARAGRTYFSSVYFVAQTEPYMTIAAPSAARDGSVVTAEVNLKFVWNVVSGIKIGKTGYAYVVDGQGRLVSHPDISLVLQMTDASQLPQVQAVARQQGDGHGAPLGYHAIARNLAGEAVHAAHAAIAPVGWTVFVEQPRAEALAPLVESIVRTALILAVALALAVAAGVVAARRMVAPVSELRRGAQRFGAGDLAHKIEVSSGDELEELASQFNAMAAQLRAIYADLERRVAERTRELHERNLQITESLEQQTATAEILRAISSSPTNTKPVFETIVANTTHLCEAHFASVFLLENERLHSAAHTKVTPAFAAYLEKGFAVDRATTAGRAVLERRPVQIVDVRADPDFNVMPPHRAEGLRTVLAVPMLREERLVGVITTWRREVRPFSEKQIRLLETFADQAVIALENLRMLEEIQEKSRALQLANQAKSRFLAAASHDLRQPMHALALFVGQLGASRAAAERAALVQRIEEAVGSLAELLDQLLDLSKLDAGAVQMTERTFAIGDSLGAIEAQFAPLARAKGIRLRVRPSRQWACSDPVLVHRVLLNLVANAIRYTERGGVLVGCRVRDGRLRVAVWDTGCGIPEDRRDDVFREFVQLGNAASRGAGETGRGLGLGLAIVARLVDLLGTRVELRSTVGRGSMFAFELPRGAATEALVPPPSAAPLRVASLNGVFVLVVDDDEAACAGMCGLLEGWGCLTVAASGGDAAIQRLHAHDRPPELILCDYQLGASENGIDAIARIRAAIGDRVPAVVITADTTAAVLNNVQAVGVPLLHKPVSPVKLRALLAQLLARANDAERAAA